MSQHEIKKCINFLREVVQHPVDGSHVRADKSVEDDAMAQYFRDEPWRKHKEKEEEKK